jgi:two-component system NtrC family response regulator/two-component system response regulator HydG
MSLPVQVARSQESVLVVDPLDLSGRAARLALSAEDRSITCCQTAQEALSLLPELKPELVIAAMDTQDLPGLRLFEAVRSRAPGTPIIVIAPHPTVEGAVQALRMGAVDYIGRPVSPGLLSEKAARALQAVRTSRNLAQAQAQARDRWGFTHLLSMSPRMIRVFDAIRAVAQTDATVLIRGETGTGKELVARAIHERSRRRAKPLIGVNCGAFTETLLESELFGHEKGSFTGAIGQRQGVFEMADGGTLFLDELGETSLNVQVNLLRVLEEMRFRRVGGRDLVEVDVRIIAATNVALEEAVKDGRFREDLYYRLNVFPITLPPLRERAEDIPILIRHFLQDAAQEYELGVPTVTPEALEKCMRYRWPGNVRQLRAMCERWVILSAGAELREDMLAPEIRGAQPSGVGTGQPLFVDDTVPWPLMLERVTLPVERAYLHKLLQKHKGHLVRTAADAGITRRTLYNRMKALGLSAEDFK